MKSPSSEDGDIPPAERSHGLLQQRLHRCAVPGCGKVRKRICIDLWSKINLPILFFGFSLGF